MCSLFQTFVIVILNYILIEFFMESTSEIFVVADKK